MSACKARDLILRLLYLLLRRAEILSQCTLHRTVERPKYSDTHSTRWCIVSSPRSSPLYELANLDLSLNRPCRIFLLFLQHSTQPAPLTRGAAFRSYDPAVTADMVPSLSPATSQLRSWCSPSRPIHIHLPPCDLTWSQKFDGDDMPRAIVLPVFTNISLLLSTLRNVAVFRAASISRDLPISVYLASLLVRRLPLAGR